MDIHYERAIVKVRITDEYDEDLEMFGIRDGGPNVKECWIPSEEGETFRITWEAKAPKLRYKNLDLRALPHLDGVKMSDGILTAAQRANGEHGCLDGEQVGADMVCPFQFGELNLTADDLVLEGRKIQVHAADLNTIKVVVDWGRAKVRELSPEDVDQATFPPPPERGLVHESSVKNGNISAAVLGNPVETEVSACTHTYTFRRDTKLEKFTFLFHYAPLEWLRQQGITPPPRGPRRAPSHTPEYIDVDAPDHDIKAEPDTDTKVGIIEPPGRLQSVILDSDEDIKSEPDTKEGVIQQTTGLQATFLDSDEEIELLGYKVPSGAAQQVIPVKVEDGVNVEVKIEPEM